MRQVFRTASCLSLCPMIQAKTGDYDVAKYVTFAYAKFWRRFRPSCSDEQMRASQRVNRFQPVPLSPKGQRARLVANAVGDPHVRDAGAARQRKQPERRAPRVNEVCENKSSGKRTRSATARASETRTPRDAGTVRARKQLGFLLCDVVPPVGPPPPPFERLGIHIHSLPVSRSARGG